jgi:hypothetical protein
MSFGQHLRTLRTVARFSRAEAAPRARFPAESPQIGKLTVAFRHCLPWSGWQKRWGAGRAPRQGGGRPGGRGGRTRRGEAASNRMGKNTLMNETEAPERCLFPDYRILPDFCR